MAHNDPRYKKLLRLLSRFPVEIEKIIEAMRAESGDPKYGVKQCLIDVANARLQGWAIYHRWEGTRKADRRWWFWLDEFQVVEVQREAEGDGVEDRISRLDQARSESRDGGDVTEGAGGGPGVEEEAPEECIGNGTAAWVRSAERIGDRRGRDPVVSADECSVY